MAKKESKIAKKKPASKTAVKAVPRKKVKAKPTRTKVKLLPVKSFVPASKPSPSKAKKVEPLTKEDLHHFRMLLLDKRAELLGDVNSIESEALKKSRLDAAGDLSSMPIHMADLGTDNFEQEFSLGLMASERKLLSEINAALKRIDDGSFGICEGTGERIPRARLEANPWARYTIEYASHMEKNGFNEPRSAFRYADIEEEEDTEESETSDVSSPSEPEEKETEETEGPAGLFGIDDEEEEEEEEKEF